MYMYMYMYVFVYMYMYVYSCIWVPVQNPTGPRIFSASSRFRVQHFFVSGLSREGSNPKP